MSISQAWKEEFYQRAAVNRIGGVLSGPWNDTFMKGCTDHSIENPSPLRVYDYDWEKVFRLNPSFLE